VTQSLFITLSTLLAVVIALGAVKVWMLFLFAFASGVVGTPDSAARQVYALDLVGTDHLTSAISLNEVVLNVSRVVGPALGGALLALEGASACCFVNAASFVPPLIVLFVLRRGERPLPVDRAPRTDHLLAGLRYALVNPTIRTSLFFAAASGMLFNLNVPLPLLATRVFHLGPGGFGLMMSVFGVGGIVVVCRGDRWLATDEAISGCARGVHRLSVLATAFAPTSASNTADCSSRAACRSGSSLERTPSCSSKPTPQCGGASWVRGRWRYPGASDHESFRRIRGRDGGRARRIRSIRSRVDRARRSQLAHALRTSERATELNPSCRRSP